MKISVWNSEAEIGYTQQTSFWMDFSIADNFGDNAIKDTYKRAFSAWKKDCVYLTELVMVLNRKCWEWHGRGNKKRSELYEKLFCEAQSWGYNNLKGDELDYFWRTLD